MKARGKFGVGPASLVASAGKPVADMDLGFCNENLMQNPKRSTQSTCQQQGEITHGVVLPIEPGQVVGHLGRVVKP